MINFLTQMIGPFPLWAWLGIGAGGVAVALFLRGRSSSGAGGALGQNASSQPNVDTSQIDPYTGVPYSIESQINPATGLPVYYGSGQTVDTTSNGQPIPPTPATTTQPAPPGPTYYPGGTQPTIHNPPADHRTQIQPGAAATVQQPVQPRQPGQPQPAHPAGQATPYWPVMMDLYGRPRY